MVLHGTLWFISILHGQLSTAGTVSPCLFLVFIVVMFYILLVVLLNFQKHSEVSLHYSNHICFPNDGSYTRESFSYLIKYKKMLQLSLHGLLYSWVNMCNYFEVSPHFKHKDRRPGFI